MVFTLRFLVVEMVKREINDRACYKNGSQILIFKIFRYQSQF